MSRGLLSVVVLLHVTAALQVISTFLRRRLHDRCRAFRVADVPRSASRLSMRPFPQEQSNFSRGTSWVKITPSSEIVPNYGMQSAIGPTFFSGLRNVSDADQLSSPGTRPIQEAAPTSAHLSEPPRNSLSDFQLDSVNRRQLLLSLLSATSVSPLLRPLQPSVAEDSLLQDSHPLQIVDVTNVIIPPLDDRKYYAYTLSNGLRVLLVSDPGSLEAAAAMDVHVGATSDPTAVSGIAHFCEHMLFLGTKKYPQEDSFEAFLSANGGSSNAYTDSLDTVYYFDMEIENDSKFAEGLVRFGSFFSAPLFTESATGRELNAIDSENAKNLQSDTFRYFQIAKSRANPQHPFSKFFTGNKKTLLDDTIAQGIDLRQQLLEFYNRFYSSNLMTLAVIGPQSIDNLQLMVSDAFGDIPNKEVDKPERAWSGVTPFGVDSSIIPAFNHLVEIVPVQDLRQVTITWPIVYQSDQDRINSLLTKPSSYVGHLLGHEGPRSLISYLKSKGWANTVAAGSEDQLSDFESFEVVVGLTPQGLAALYDVIEAVFAFISLLRDKAIPAYVFDEVLQLDELQWRFMSKGNVGNYVQSLSSAMQKYPPKLYVAGPRRLALDGFDSYGALTGNARTDFTSREQFEQTRSEVERFVNSLTVDNAMFTVLSKTFDGLTDHKERWYGTDYRVRAIPSFTLDRWCNSVRTRNMKIDFPRPNPFIPSEAGLLVKRPPSESLSDPIRARSFESRMQPLTPPRVIRDDGPEGRWTVHFKQDNRFGQPKGYLIFQLLTKDPYASSMQAALSNLYEICVSDRLREYAYDAELAGLSYDVKVLPRGVRLTFGGYSDKLPEFASYISRKVSREIRDVLPQKDSDFERYKDQILRGLSAFDVKQPYAHASYFAQLTLQPMHFQYSNKDLRDATRKITLPDLVEYANTLWAYGKGEALVQGNFDEKEALDLVAAIGDTIPFRPISISAYPTQLEALPLPATDAKVLPTRLLVAEPNPSNENSVSYVMLQSLGKSEKDHVLIELLGAILQEPFYNELRTKKQLGYIVSSGVRGIGESRTLAFVVQSSVAESDELTIQILDFLENVEDKILQRLGKGDFAVYVKGLIDRKTEPDKDLTTEVTRNWSEIASGRLQFDRIQREAAALLNLEKNDLLSFWKQLYAGNGRRVLISEVIPRQGPASSALPPSSFGYKLMDLTEEALALGVDDIDQFRRDREQLGESYSYMN